MNSELEHLIQQESWDYAAGCHGVCEKMRNMKDRDGAWPVDGLCPCERCKDECRAYGEFVDHMNGAKWMLGVVGDQLLSQYVIRLIKREGV